ncbi:MAG TPA: TolC family protein [Gammaproteobacteria bacterium]|nr:TolC family protein [Gammaproteobacteria bacterium]
MIRYAVLALMLALPAATANASALTEAEAVRRGLSHPQLQAMQESTVGEALGASAAAGRWPNPEIELGRERVDGSSRRSNETDVWIRQRLDLAGVRARERDAAQTLVVAARARADMVDREQARDIRRRFYDALAADALLGLAGDWRDRLDLLVAAAVRRVDAGDASRYELLRLQKELSVVKAEFFERQAAAASARERLFAMIGGEPARLSGMLLPPAMDPAMAPGLLADHPLLRALEAESDSALLSSEAASRRRWPALTLGAGWREVDEAGHSADGGMFMVGVEIPIFDRGTGDRDAAASRARRSTAERWLAEERLAAEARSALGELQARRAGALLLSDHESEETSFLSIAEAAYEAGEIGVAELIDAHRTELAVARERIERSRLARESFIELQYVGGRP